MFVHQITIPSDPQKTVTLTITGSNSPATFDDCFEGVCNGGAGDGQFCTVATEMIDCPGGMCEAFADGRFCPDSRNGKPVPGWWEGFHIDRCANVRVDFCCTEPVLRPSFSNLWTGCPAAGLIGEMIVRSPIGLGFGSVGYSLSCPASDDNSVGTFGPLAPGTYYKAIWGGAGGTFRAPIIGGEEGRVYQMHVTAAACPTAACCAELCEAGLRDGRPCAPGGVQSCKGGRCVDGVCVDGVFDGFVCDSVTGEVDQCPGGVCGTMTGCVVTNQLECEAADGFWMADFNVPETICVGGENNGALCFDLGDCPGGTECRTFGNADTCDPDGMGVGPCDTGSCCIARGECTDRVGMDAGDLTEADCVGEFIGGARCEFNVDPCPICALSGPEACTIGNGGFVFSTDRALGNITIDDFVAVGAGLKELCWWNEYGDRGFGPCAGDIPAANWNILIYEDNNGVPGARLPLSPGELTQVGFYPDGCTPASIACLSSWALK